MTLVEALGKIEALGQSLFETKDVAALLGIENSNANKIVSRLAQGGLIIPIRRGTWALRTLKQVRSCGTSDFSLSGLRIAAERALSPWDDFTDPRRDLCRIARPYSTL